MSDFQVPKLISYFETYSTKDGQQYMCHYAGVWFHFQLNQSYFATCISFIFILCRELQGWNCLTSDQSSIYKAWAWIQFWNWGERSAADFSPHEGGKRRWGNFIRYSLAWNCIIIFLVLPTSQYSPLCRLKQYGTSQNKLVITLCT